MSRSQWETIGKTAGWYNDDPPSRSEAAADDFKHKVTQLYKDAVKEARDEDISTTIKKLVSVIGNGKDVMAPTSVDEVITRLNILGTQFGKYLAKMVKDSLGTIADLSAAINIVQNATDYIDQFENGNIYEFETSIEDFASEVSESEEEARDPYGYRGVSIRDFYDPRKS